MAETSTSIERYDLSFGTGALLVREAVLLAEAREPGEAWEDLRVRAIAQNLIQSRAARSTVRHTRAALKRVSTLDDDEIDVLLDSTATDRALLMWAASCRAFTLIGEFAEEVLRERFLLLTPMVTHDEFDAFLSSKGAWHPELVGLAVSTTKKLRETVFRMMVEADLVTKAGAIVPVVLPPRLTALLDARDPSDLRFFPTRRPMSGSEHR